MVPALAVIAVYVLAMLLLAPRFVERELKKSVAQEPGMTLEMSAVAVNPFTLALSATNIKLIGPENTLVVSAESMQATVHALSPVRGSWIVRRLVLDGIRAELRVPDAGSRGALKLASGLLRAAAGNPAQDLDIQRLAVRRGEVRIRSAADAAAPRAGLVLSDLELETRGSEAETAGRPIRMTAAINNTALVEASGRFESSRDTLTARLTALVDNASVFAPYVSLAPDLQWRAGELRGDVALVHRFESSRVEASLALQQLNITDADSGDSVLTASRVAGSGIVTEISGESVSVGTIRLDTPRLRLMRDAAGDLVPLRQLRSLLSGAGGSPVAVAGIEVSGGTVDFSDNRFSPPLRIESTDWHGSISKHAGDDALTDLSLSGRAVGGGAAEITAEWLPTTPRQLTRVALRVRDLALGEFSPYVQAAIGRSVSAGVLDGTFRLSLDQGRVAIDSQMAIKELQLRQAAANEPGQDSPLQLAIALLQDKEGQIDIRVPVPEQRLAPDFDPFAVFGDALAAYARAAAETPFQQLAELVSQPQLSLGHLAFPAGSAEISADTAGKISALGAALAMRPQLGLTVLPGYDPAADRQALARQKIRLHVILATSAVPPGQAAGEQSIDFDDGRVRSVLDEFAQSRLPANRLARISNRHPDRNTAHYRAVFEALVDNEVVDDAALQRLARYRARTVIDELEHAGIDSERIKQADRIGIANPDAGRGAIELTVWPVVSDPPDNESIDLR